MKPRPTFETGDEVLVSQDSLIWPGLVVSVSGDQATVLTPYGRLRAVHVSRLSSRKRAS